MKPNKTLQKYKQLLDFFAFLVLLTVIFSVAILSYHFFKDFLNPLVESIVNETIFL